MATIFVDEAGYTGSNLLDPAQPVFVLCTHDLEEPDAQQLKAKHFAHVKAASLKFTKLAVRHPDALLRFLADIATTYPDRFITFIVHKPFAMLCKLVDSVVETAMHEHGVELYEKGGNLALCNLMFLLLKSVAGDEYLNRLLLAAKRLFDEDALPATEALFALLDEKTGLSSGVEPTEPLADVLSILQLALWKLLKTSPDHLLSMDKHDLSVSMSVAVSVLSKWGERHRNQLDVIHDESSVMLRQLDFWTKATAGTLPPTTVGMDRRTIEFPIGVQTTRFERDEDWAGLQLADLVAGGLSVAMKFVGGLNQSPPNEFEQKLINVLGSWTAGGTIWPRLEFTPEALGTEGPSQTDAFAFYEKHLS